MDGGQAILPCFAGIGRREPSTEGPIRLPLRPIAALCLLAAPICGPGHAQRYLDEEPHRIMGRCAPGVTHWMMQFKSVDPFAAGEWLDPSDPPASLRDLLRVTGRAAAAYIADTVRALRELLVVADIASPRPRGRRPPDAGLPGAGDARDDARTLFMVPNRPGFPGACGTRTRRSGRTSARPSRCASSAPGGKWSARSTRRRSSATRRVRSA
jgi:hypothetical protein